MFKGLDVYRSTWIYGICLALAVFLGYLLASPFGMRSLAIFGLVIFVVGFPVLMRWHHPILIFTWNASLIVFFLPGAPALWMTMAVMGCFFAVLNRTLLKETGYLPVPSVVFSLLFLGMVVVVTAYFTGGIGARALGSVSYGGKKYLSIFAAIMGYFALVSQSIPRNRAVMYAALFFISGVTALASNAAYSFGPSFSFLYAFFPAVFAGSQALGELTFLRLAGVSFAAQAVQLAMLLGFGIRGLMDMSKPWRLIVFLILLGASLLGGFRSTFILLLILFAIQFYFEGLFRSRYFPITILAVALASVMVVAFASKMPLAVQRSLSFLPIEVDSRARLDAVSTLDWRLQMWRVLMPEVPKYFWLGKGFSFSGTDLFLTDEAVKRGHFSAYESTLINGDYHHGILTIIIPFGIFGLISFTVFCWTALRVLYDNFRYGDPELHNVNTFLISLFIAKLIFYTFFYGQFDLDLPAFVGITGLSISLNRGVRRFPQEALEPAPAEEFPLLLDARRV